MTNTFIKVENQLIDMANEKKLSLVEVMILAKIEEFERNKCECYMTNEQFAYVCLCSASTITRSLTELKDMGMINIINPRSAKRVIKRIHSQNDYVVKDSQNDYEADTSSKCLTDISKMPMLHKQNDFIKDNIKDKEIDNNDMDYRIANARDNHILTVNKFTPSQQKGKFAF